MAPRRGGGGGSYYSSSSSSNNLCSQNDAFDDTWSRVYVAFLGVFILLGAALLWVYVFHLRKPTTRKAAPAYLYGLALLLWEVSQVISLLQLVFAECDVGALNTNNDLGLTVTWLYTIIILLLLATVLFTVCSVLFSTTQSRTWRLLKIVHIFAFALLAVLQIASGGMYSWLAKAGSATIRRSAAVIRAMLRFFAAVDFITFLIIVLASVSLILAWSAGRKGGRGNKGVLPWIIVFAVACGVNWLIIFGLDVNNITTPSGLTPDAFLAQLIVRRFLELLVFVAVITMARQAASSGPAGDDKPYQYAPYTSYGAPEITHYQPQTTFANQQHPQQGYVQQSAPVPPAPQQQHFARPPSPQQYSQQTQASHNSYYSTSPSPRPAPESAPLVGSQPPQQPTYQAYRP